MLTYKSALARFPRKYDALFSAAARAVAEVRTKSPISPDHRSFARINVSHWTALQTLMLPLVFSGTLLWAEPYLMDAWRTCIVFWASALDLPISLTMQAAQFSRAELSASPINNRAYMPDPTIFWSTVLLTAGLLVSSFRMPARMLPIVYSLRMLCALQIISILFFWFIPAQFTHTISDHAIELANVGYVLMVAIPVMLAAGFYAIKLSLPFKILITVSILGYFAVEIPHQIVLHMLILSKFSLIYMPVLYLCFGPLFNMLIFVALYSLVLSVVPTEGMT
jgi:hypothetical protein